MIEHSAQCVALLAPDGSLIAANARAAASLGLDPTRLTEGHVWESPAWAAPEVREKLRASITAAARGTAVRQELEVNSNGGSPTTVDLAFSPVADDASGGAISLIVAEWHDITDRKRTEAALRESEDRFHRIVAIAADAIISMDESQRITLFNQGAEAIFGYPASEAIGQPLDILLPRDISALHAKEVRAFSGAPDVARRMGDRRQIFGRRKSGEIFSAEASISKARIGGAWVYTAVLRDVTARWAAEQEKSELLEATQRARDDAERAARQRDEMLAIVSHDLRNPLSAIGMCANLLAKPETSADERERLAGIIGDSVAWTNRLIADLRDIASIEAGKLSIARVPLDPVLVIARALALFDAQAAARSIRLHAVGAEHLPSLEADSERILQVLANLIGNALKHTPAGGTITVGGDVRGRELEFSVRDTGSGISAEDLPHVFERRWHTGTGPAHGTGLGLAIARGIVEAHGGHIRVTSAPGRGSAFQFTVPLSETA